MIETINDPQAFPELNFDHFQQRYAKKWTTYGPCAGLPISRIVLYRYSSRYQKYLRSLVPTKFAIVFEFYYTDMYTDTVFNEAKPRHFESAQENIEYIKNEANDSAEVKKYKEFVRHTQFRQSGGKTYNAFFDSSFATSVYRDAKGPDGYIHEWILIPRPPADAPPYWC